MRRRLAWLAAGILMLGAWVVIAERGKHTGHDEAWIAGAMFGTLVIAVLVVALVRLAWVRGLHRGSRVWTGPALVAVGVVSLAAAAASAARTNAARNARSIAGDAASLVINSAGSGYNSNRDDLVQGLMHQVRVDPHAATQGALPNGRRLISFARDPVSGAITFSGCYALVVEAGDARVARAVASVLR